MRPIVLAGFTGTGKTTIGKHLAQRLGYTFIDTDWLIEEREERTIAHIFATDGEAYFRQLEANLCYEIITWYDVVVATGGGMLVSEKNVRVLEPYTVVVCLDSAPDVLWKRLEFSQERPLLHKHKETKQQKKARIEALYAERKDAYARLPHHVDTTRGVTDDAIHAIMALLPTNHESI